MIGRADDVAESGGFGEVLEHAIVGDQIFFEAEWEKVAQFAGAADEKGAGGILGKVHPGF